MIDRRAWVDLRPVTALDAFPFDAAMARWIDLGFAPTRCAAALRELLAGTPQETLVRWEGFADGGLLLHPEALFPTPGGWRLTAGRVDLPDALVGSEVPAGMVEVVAQALRLAAWCEEPELVREEADFLGAALLDLLLGGPPAPRWTRPDGDALQRREHASLLLSFGGHAVLLDPVAQATRFPHISDAPLPDDGPLDAVLVSHLHTDHWHLPSLLGATGGPEIPIVVPQVPRPCLLTPTDPVAELTAAGQAVRAGRWGESLAFGALTVDILPFYGEQPTRTGPGAIPGLRNRGNAFGLRAGGGSALVLVDTGADPEGAMVDAAAAWAAQHGPPDLVLACVRRFECPFFGGLSSYWGALPFERLLSLYAEWRAGGLPTTTAGPDGIAAVCAATGARAFLPYADGFAGVGVPIPDVGWGMGEPAEEAALLELEGHLSRLSAPTRVRRWNPGDALPWPPAP